MINPISVTSASFYLYNYYTNAVVRSTITMAPDRLSATLVPDAALEPHWYYYYYVSPFTDIAGNTGGLGAHLLPHRRRRGHAAARARVGRAGQRRDRCAGQRAHSGRRLRAHRCRVDRRVQLTPAVAGSIAVDTDRLGFLFTPAANLAVSTTYTLQIGPLRDSSGNTMAAVVTSFTTSASPTPDTTGPTVVSF